MFGFPSATTLTGFAKSPKIPMASSAPPPPTSHISKKNNFQVARPMPPQKVEIFKSMEQWTRDNILPLAKPVERCWQPQDFLPDSSSEGFQEQVNALRERAMDLPDDYLVVLVGDMISEETLPSYQSSINRKEVIGDETGVSESPWAIWSRSWSADERRHSDVLNKYLYLSGRVDMRQVEKTTQHLINAGVDDGTGSNPYLMFIYSTFQERATFISHGNTAKLAKRYGDSSLARICGTISADEKRHEFAYTNIVEKLFELDPDETVVCFAEMLRRRITMPGSLMHDGRDPSLFQHFSAVAARVGVYSAMDYVGVLEHLVDRWNVEKLTGLSGEGRAAQDYVCGLGSRMRKAAERARESVAKDDAITFSWIL